MGLLGVILELILFSGVPICRLVRTPRRGGRGHATSALNGGGGGALNDGMHDRRALDSDDGALDGGPESLTQLPFLLEFHSILDFAQ